VTGKLGWALFIVVVASAACGASEQGPSPGSDTAAALATRGAPEGGVYERNVVFASLEGDSTFLVSWLMKATEGRDSVEREAHGLLARGGVWDAFFQEQWRTPPTRSPARILPHDELRLLVRDEGAVDGIIFEDPPRNLEIILGEGDASWTGTRGGSFQILAGSAYLADQHIEGLVLDMARASNGERPPGGDWAFLLSGDSAHFVLAADAEHGGEVEPLYQGWGENHEEPLRWPEVRIDWRRTEAFPPARRDVPVEWEVWSSDGAIAGLLEATSAEIRAGAGPGPLLPVRALYEVSGDISTTEGVFTVHGVLAHERR